MEALRPGALGFQLDLVQSLAILAQFGLDGIAALGAFGVFRFAMLDDLGLLAHLLGEDVDLSVELRAFLIQLGQLAGQYQSQFRPHFLAQFGIAFRFRGLALERIHLARDFVENVIHPRQVLLGVFQTRFGQPLLGLELGDAGGLFDDGASIGWTAAQNLPNPSLLDQRVGLRAEPGPHEQFLNVAQAAQLAIQQILAVARTEQTARDHQFARTKLLRIEFAAPNFQHDLRTRRRLECDRRRGFRFRRGFERSALNSLGFAGPGFLGQPLSFLCGSGAKVRFIPVFARQLVLNFDLGRFVSVGAVIDFGIDQGERYLGHAGRLAVIGPGEDDVFHARPAQRLGRLLAEDPRNGVRNVRLATPVRADDGRNPIAVKLELGAVAERLEPENLQPFQFEQRKLLRSAVRTCGAGASPAGVAASRSHIRAA